MASNLTNQVREIASVTTAVAQGDLTQKITEDGKGGEVLILSNTITAWRFPNFIRSRGNSCGP